MEEEQKVRCGKCWKFKSPSEFFKNISRKRGIMCYCKDCATLSSQKNRTKTRNRNITRETRKRNPVKSAARIIFSNALQAGKIQKQPCFFCGEEKVEGHHLLYDYPMKVIWLCKKHHYEVHDQIKLYDEK